MYVYTYVAIQCSSIYPLFNGDSLITGTGYQSTVKYLCNNGYILNGTSERVCLSNGFWYPEEPRCEGIYTTQ